MPHRNKMLYTFSYGRHIKLTSHQKTLLACKKVEEMFQRGKLFVVAKFTPACKTNDSLPDVAYSSPPGVKVFNIVITLRVRRASYRNETNIFGAL